MRAIVLLTIFSAVPAASLAQLPSEQVLSDETYARMEVTTDRAEYFVGEEMFFRLKITNPTNRALIVRDPARPHPVLPHHYIFRLVSLDSAGKVQAFWPMLEEGGSPDNKPYRGGLITIAPGQSIEWSGRTSESIPQFGFDAVPRVLGRYNVRLELGEDRQGSIRAVSGIVEAAGDVWAPDRSRTEATPSFWIFSVRRNNESHICVSLQKRAMENRVPLGQQLHKGPEMVEPFRRVGLIANPVATIAGTVSPTGAITIIYTDSTGTQRRIDLDKNKFPINP